MNCKRVWESITKNKILAFITSLVLLLLITLYIIYYEFAKYPIPESFSFSARSDVQPKDWLLFWGSFLSFIGSMSLGMVSLIQNDRLNKKNQKLEEYKFAQENCSIIRQRDLARIRLYEITEEVIKDMRFYNSNRLDTVNFAQWNSEIPNMCEHIANNKDNYICLATDIYFINDRKTRADSFLIDYFAFGIYADYDGLPQKQKEVNIFLHGIDIGDEKKKGSILDAFRYEEREIIEKNNTEEYFKIQFNLYLDKKHYEWVFKTNFGIEFNYRMTVENGLDICTDFIVRSRVKTNGEVRNEDFSKMSYTYLDCFTKISKVKAYKK